MFSESFQVVFSHRVNQCDCFSRDLASKDKMFQLFNHSHHDQLWRISESARRTVATQWCKAIKRPLSLSLTSIQMKHLDWAERCCTVFFYNNRRHCWAARRRGAEWDQPPRPSLIPGNALSLWLSACSQAEWWEHMVLLPVDPIRADKMENYKEPQTCPQMQNMCKTHRSTAFVHI